MWVALYGFRIGPRHTVTKLRISLQGLSRPTESQSRVQGTFYATEMVRR